VTHIDLYIFNSPLYTHAFRALDDDGHGDAAAGLLLNCPALAAIPVAHELGGIGVPARPHAPDARVRGGVSNEIYLRMFILTVLPKLFSKILFE